MSKFVGGGATGTAALPALDGRTAVARALRAFQALPDRENASRLSRHFGTGDGRSWTPRESAQRLGIPGEIILTALTVNGAKDRLAAALIEEMGLSAQVIVAADRGGQLIWHKAQSADQWLGGSAAELRPDSKPVRLIKAYGTWPIAEVAALTRTSEAEMLRRLHARQLGGLCVDGAWFISRLHLARQGVLPLKSWR
jgi:hypothetical protein